MNPKIKTLLSVVILCLSFIWILPFLGMLPITGEYVIRRAFFGVIGTLLALLIVNIIGKLDGEDYNGLGLKWRSDTFLKFVVGLGVGFSLVSIMVFIIVFSSDYYIELNTQISFPKALLGLIGFIPLALMEEIIFRGYPFRKLQKVFGLRITQVVMAILFALYHDRTGASLHLQLMGPGIWAFIYGIAAVWSKGIALPTGIHAAANITLALVGTKHEDFAIWNMELKDSISDSFQNNEMVGYVLMLCLLVVGIGMTEWWIRKNNKHIN